MTKYGSNSVAFILIDGYSVLGFSTVLNDSVEGLFIDSTVLGDSWGEAAFVGLRKGSLQQDGFFDDTAGATNDALSGNTGISRIAAYGVAGNTIGKPFVGWAGAMQIDYQRLAVRGDLHRANAKYNGSGAIDSGLIVHALAAEVTATGNTQSTSVDQGGIGAAIAITSSSIANPSVITTTTPHGFLSTDHVLIAGHSGSTPSINGGQIATVTGPTTFTIPVNVTVGGTGGTATRVSGRSGAAYLELPSLALGGFTSFTVTVQDSADNAAWADIASGGFAAATTAPGAQRLVIPGTIRRYAACRWVFNGAGGSESATFMAGLARNPN